jgi:hypothetical protein
MHSSNTPPVSAAQLKVGPGTGFWAKPTPEVPKPHPYFVIAGPVGGMLLAVNLTELDKFTFRVEHTCIVKEKEHPNVGKDSAANYIPGNPIEIKETNLAKVLANAPSSGVRHLPDLKANLLERLRTGARESQEMDPRLKRKYALSSK